MSTDDELMREFLLESWEGLNQLDRDFVALETNPGDRERLGAIFRCIHTIKGASGFLSLRRLEAVAHAGENLLSRLRNGDLELDGPMTTALLAMVDAIRAILGEIDTTGGEGDRTYSDLIALLTSLSNGGGQTASAQAAPVEAAVAECVPSPLAPVLASPSQGVPTQSPSARSAEDVQEKAGGSMSRPQAPSEVAEASASRSVSISDTAIRVDVGLLDRVMNLVGELVLARNQILQFGSSVKDPSFAKASQRLNLLTTELQEQWH